MNRNTTMKKQIGSILFFVFLLPHLVFGGEEHQLLSLTNDNGLSASLVTSIIKDSLGFMWFTTSDGLNRFDGQEFKVFRQNINEAHSLPAENIRRSFIDFEGKLWLSTVDSGLCVMDPYTEKFYKIRPPGPFDKMNIMSITSDKNNNIWAGTWTQGLLFYNQKSKKSNLIHLPSRRSDNKPVNIRDMLFIGDTLWIATQHQGLIKYLPGSGILQQFFTIGMDNIDTINSIHTLAYNGEHLWLGTTRSHLFRFDLNTHKVLHIKYLNEKYDHSFRTVTDLLFQGKDSLWISSTDGGIFLLNTASLQADIFSCEEMKHGLNYNSISCLYLDNQNILWVGNNGMGINYFRPEDKRFELFSTSETSDFMLDFRSVRAINKYKDILYIGGYYGINEINTKTKKTTYLIEETPVYAIAIDSINNQIIIGTEGANLYTYKTNTKEIKRHLLEFQKKTGTKIRLEFIYKILPINDNRFLLGTIKGIAVLNGKTLEIEAFYEHEPGKANSLQPGYVFSLFKDSRNRIWIGTDGGGLSLFDMENGSFTRFNVSNTKNELLSNVILSINEDIEGKLWLGTDRGLCGFVPEDRHFITITTKDGLPNSTVYAVLEDKNGKLWLSTNQGICSFDQENRNIEQFTTRDGLMNNEFNKAAYFKDAEGFIYFGGVEGVVRFEPSKINLGSWQQTPVFSQISVFNAPIETDTIIPYKRMFHILPNYHFISFEVSSLNYLYPGENQYQYRLLGLSDQWINNGKNSSVSLVDPTPGKYELQVRTSLNGHNWVETKNNIKLIVKPRLIESKWFIISMVILLVLLVFIIFQVRFHYLKAQEILLQKQVDRRTHELSDSNENLKMEISIREATEKQLRDANHTKDKFFSIIAHDLRSPFMSLQGFSDLLMQEWDDYNEKEKQEMVRKINKNSRTTFRLLNSLLEWSRLQQGTIKAQLSDIKACAVAEEVLNEISAQAEIKNIRMLYQCNQGIKLIGDENMLATVLRNILSNSIKFTHENGLIRCSVKETIHKVRITIEDNGIGMDEQTSKNLFRIENSSREGTNGEKGSGFGLVIAAELIRLMKGSIQVESQTNQGSRFIIEFPRA